MLRATKEWDIRCPRRLTNMFPVRAGYYYKVTRKQARRICRVLCRAYGIPAALVTVRETLPERPYRGTCYYMAGRRSEIELYPRAHIKSVFHEWYHALDHATRGKYNSSDSYNFGWEFADRLFEVFRNQKPKRK